MSAYLDWKVGDKLVCVDNTGQQENLTVGTVYTLSNIGGGRSGIYVGLVEVPKQTDGLDWYPSRFRKVVTRKTSIAVFEALLNPSEAETFRELEAEEFDYELNEEPFR